MAISDLISSSFLFSVAIIIILIGGVFAYVTYRFTQQDHKLSTMVGLISTMTDEIQYLKNISYGGSNNHFHQQPNENEKNIIILDNSETNKIHSDNLIHVSDNEYDYQEDTVSESDDDNEDDVSVSESEDDDVSLSESHDDDEDNVENEDENDDDTHTDVNDEFKEITNLDTDSLEDIIDENEIKILNLGAIVNDISEHISEQNIKSIHLEEQFDLNFDNFSTEIENINSSDLKTISITLSDTNVNDFGDDIIKNKSSDYKKLALNELKKVVVKKGLVTASDASKLKKNELLKMLEDE